MVSFNRTRTNCLCKLTLHIDDDKHGPFGVDDNGGIICESDDRDGLGRVLGGAIKLRTSHIHATGSRRLDVALNINDGKLVGGHEPRTWAYSLIERIPPNRFIGGGCYTCGTRRSRRGRIGLRQDSCSQ